MNAPQHFPTGADAVSAMLLDSGIRAVRHIDLDTYDADVAILSDQQYMGFDTEAINAIRSSTRTRIILVIPSGLDQEVPADLDVSSRAEKSEIRCLEAGADLVVRPEESPELLAKRIEVLEAQRGFARLGNFLFDFTSDTVINLETHDTLELRRMGITGKLKAVLRYLLKHYPETIGRDELLQCVWNMDPAIIQTHTVETSVYKLRKSLIDAQCPYFHIPKVSPFGSNGYTVALGPAPTSIEDKS